MGRIKLSKLFVITIIVICITILYQIFFMESLVEQISNSHELPIVLWWTPFGSYENFRDCGNNRCFFTQNRSYFSDSRLNTILFYGSDLQLNDLPIPRQSNMKWALLHEESPRNNLIFVHEKALQLFNYSATFSRYSDLPLTLVDLPGENELLSQKYFIPTSRKNQLIKMKNLAPVLYIQSNCDTMNDRDLYIIELMNYIAVDSYGVCVNNRQLPYYLKENYIDRLHSDEFYTFVSQYKFTLAFENANCDDYITEKLWRPLIAGSVPVYYGSPTYKDWLPNDDAAIAVQDFEHPRKLAQYLIELTNNDDKYERHLRHKFYHSITNSRLRNVLKTRPNNLINIFEYYVREFECLVCRKLHENHIQTMTSKQYNCSKPKKIFANDKNMKNQWSDMWDYEARTAQLLFRWLSQRDLNSTNQFNIEKMKFNMNDY